MDVFMDGCKMRVEVSWDSGVGTFQYDIEGETCEQIEKLLVITKKANREMMKSSILFAKKHIDELKQASKLNTERAEEE
jgi:hypothetical protein